MGTGNMSRLPMKCLGGNLGIDWHPIGGGEGG